MTDDYSTAPAARAGASPDTASAGPRSRTGARLGWLVVAVIVSALLARLGVWQLSRAHEKVALGERIAARGAMAPLAAGELARDAAGATDQWERRVVLDGRWLPERTIWLGNRTMDEYSGFYVLTPLRLADGGVVVVQRGWLPVDLVDMDRLPPLATPAGDVHVEGRVAPWPAHRIELGRQRPGAVRQNLELGAISAETGLPLRPLTIVEEAGSGNARDGLKRHWATPAGSALTNYGYAAQWFAMSATVLGLYAWLQFFRRRDDASTDA